MKSTFRLLGYNIKASEKEIDKVRKLSQNEFIEWQEMKKWEIARHHFNNNNFYKSYVGPSFPTNWNKLPILEKGHIQQNAQDIVSKPFQNSRIYRANTSGSTGMPLNFVKDKTCHARTWATIYNLYGMYGIVAGSKEARFYGMPKDFMGNMIEKMKDFFFNRERFVTFDMSDYVLDKFINRFSQGEFIYIYGYTHALVLFAEHLAKGKTILKNICPSLEKVIITSELCTKREKKIIEEGVGVPVINEYGASEFSIIAFECENGNQHIIEENLYVENNNKGEILITDLFNQAMPFIRYNIGDIGQIMPATCTCQLSNNRLLTNLIGRTNDIIILPSGKISPGLTFYYITKGILEKSEGTINAMQARQVAVDLIELDVVSTNDLGDNERILIEDEIDTYLEEKIQVKINNLKTIPKHPSGKIMSFRSEIDNQYIIS